MGNKSRAATRAMNATYRKFANVMQFNGREILYMDDIDVNFERGLNRVVKVRTWELNFFDVQLNENRLRAHTIGIGRVMFRIISFQYHGNDQEEVLLILEGGGFD